MLSVSTAISLVLCLLIKNTNKSEKVTPLQQKRSNRYFLRVNHEQRVLLQIPDT